MAALDHFGSSHFWVDFDHPPHHKYKNKIKNTHRSNLPKLRQKMAGIRLIFPGKEIEFAEKQQIYFSTGYMKNSGYTKSNVYIISSEKEFDSFINPNVEIKSGNYNETYFENKSIIAFFIPHYSSSYETHVDSVKKENNEIYIELITFVPASRAINTDYWLQYILIEINKADLLNVNKFNYFEIYKAI